MVNTFTIASFGKRVSAVVFGVFDLLNDLGVEYTKESEGAKYSRAKIPVDGHAAGVAVIDAIWQDLKDVKGLEKDCKIGKSLGYTGKSIIHPDQISVSYTNYFIQIKMKFYGQKESAKFILNQQRKEQVLQQLMEK